MKSTYMTWLALAATVLFLPACDFPLYYSIENLSPETISVRAVPMAVIDRLRCREIREFLRVGSCNETGCETPEQPVDEGDVDCDYEANSFTLHLHRNSGVLLATAYSFAPDTGLKSLEILQGATVLPYGLDSFEKRDYAHYVITVRAADVALTASPSL